MRLINFKTVTIEHPCPKRKSDGLIEAVVSWDDVMFNTYECEDCGSHTDIIVDIKRCGYCGKRHWIEDPEIGEPTIDGKGCK